MPGLRGTLHEWKQGTLHSGSKKGPIVKSQKQAIAIGLSQERKQRGSKNALRDTQSFMYGKRRPGRPRG